MASNILLTSAAPAIISPQGVANAAAVLPSLAGRSVTSYAQSFMIAGIIISVIGVSAAIFTSMLLTGIGFGLAGIVSVIGVFLAQSAFEGERLQNSIAYLNRQDALLGNERIKLDSVVTLLKQENDDLKRSQKILDLRCKELEGENTRIHQLSRELVFSLQELKIANGILSESKSVLIAKVAELQGYVAETKSVLQTFVATHSEFSSRVGCFAGAVENLDHTKGVIQSSIADLETQTTVTLPGLRDLVTLAREISDYIQTRVQEQSQQQSGSIEAFRKEVQVLRTQIESFQVYIRELERINAAFTVNIESSHSIERLQGAHRKALSDLIRNLEESSAKFERERGLFRAEAESLQTTFRDLLRERESLVRTLQPQIQALAASRRVDSHSQATAIGETSDV